MSAELIARLESAEGPDRELDAAIWRFKLGDTTGDHWFSDGQGNVTNDYQAPTYTASIDAALTLFDIVPDMVPSNPRKVAAAALKARGV